MSAHTERERWRRYLLFPFLVPLACYIKPNLKINCCLTHRLGLTQVQKKQNYSGVVNTVSMGIKKSNWKDLQWLAMESSSARAAQRTSTTTKAFVISFTTRQSLNEKQTTNLNLLVINSTGVSNDALVKKSHFMYSDALFSQSFTWYKTAMQQSNGCSGKRQIKSSHYLKWYYFLCLFSPTGCEGLIPQ